MNPTTNTEAGAVADVAAIARRLTKAQRAAVQDCPGNPDYCRGAPGSMSALKDKALIQYFNAFASNGKRSGLLTPLGLAVRQHLEQGATAGVAEMNEQMFVQGDG